MSRIKYPGEQEMKRQIQVILDESGMFEDDEKSQGYTECVQVKKRPAVKTAILFPLAAAAVMFLVVCCGISPAAVTTRNITAAAARGNKIAVFTAGRFFTCTHSV